MRVAVTGVSGRLGQAVLPRLLEQEVEVIGIDSHAPQPPRANTVVADLCDLGQVCGALAGADAVIHLGAIPAPTGYPPEVVYCNNVLSQFNVCEAACMLDIRRVVSASSVSALGFPYQHRWSEPLYVPIDEQHPLLPQDAYGLSKANGEEIVAAYCRRGAGSAASLRFSCIVSAEGYDGLIEAVRDDPGASAHELWSYVDLRDAVEACLLALMSPFEGHQPLFISAADTTAELPTDVLLDRYYPAVARRPGGRPPRWSLLDGARAAQVLGYHPQYSWTRRIAGPECDMAGPNVM